MGFEPTTFCMASRRAGESAPLGERRKPLVAGNRWGRGAFGCVWDNDWDSRSLRQGDGFVALKARKTSLLADETGTGADGFTHRATGGRTRTAPPQ